MAIHHINLRKRKHAKATNGLHPYPHPDRKMQLLDTLVMTIAIIGPVMFIPQIYDIYTTQDAESINFHTFAASCILVLPWIAYGVVHKEKVVYVSSVLSLIVYVLIAVGAFLYG